MRDNEINGIKTYDYHLPEDIFYNATLNPDNEGFCDSDCLGNGVLNLAPCRAGTSFYISQPHFLNADQKFIDSLRGVKPNQTLHDLVFHFEPVCEPENYC